MNCAPHEIQSSLPDELARLRDQAEIRIRPATGDKGSELDKFPLGALMNKGLTVRG
ncbi:hypothetical protein SK803_03075 [Lentzea sp. BCCO 10_0856]|uniref:Uncharacterized protein n=1 Tax=Lentzea miocenica TaxID=3095431 RepID=A0ABU4STH1_9PSEU|nr:hypothetical protein [Lentzea sp. BCCO 10_0856]MDX8029173.1 hypothetical protein [Lentzea sp. BCCO 10_0856]